MDVGEKVDSSDMLTNKQSPGLLEERNSEKKIKQYSSKTQLKNIP